MLPTLEENELKKLHFEDIRVSFFYDHETDSWVIDPDDEEEDAFIVQSPEHPFEPFILGTEEINEEVFRSMKDAYEAENPH